MARVGTPNLNLGTFVDGENPGAGDQVTDNTGLNGNWIKIDTAIGAEHNTNGTHKDDKIAGSSLKAAIADGSTLEFSAPTGAKVIRVKDAGITAAKMVNAGVFTGDAGSTFPVVTIGAGAITATKLASDAVETAKIKDANVTTEKLEYKEYVGTITQVGTAAPVVTEIKNTLGITFTPSRTGVGYYYLTASSAVFTANKTVSFLSNRDDVVGDRYIFHYSTSIIKLATNIAGTPTDGVLSSCAILIRVYP